jgi:hypothetical protein
MKATERFRVHRARIDAVMEELGTPIAPDTPPDQAMGRIAKALERLMPDGPRLGLATTRQLLEELSARGRVERSSGTRPLAGALERAADRLLLELRAEVLDYRTVDHS